MSTDGFRGVIGNTVPESTPAWPRRPQPPEGAPNVVFIVLDDTGFAHLGCYGSDIETPNMDRLAAGGLRYNNFHTTALCSPTRACLLTGRNHHSVGVGRITEITSGFPGYYGQITDRAATLAEVLRSHGYNTIACGKWHLLPNSHTSAAGPFDQWPLGRGFDHYYGFLGGETDQWRPDLAMGNERILPPDRPGLSPDGGPRRPRDRLRARPEVARAGQAVLPLPGVRRHPRPAPRAEGVHREVPRPLRRRLGRRARPHLRAAEEDGGRAAGHGARAAKRRRKGVV